MQFADAPLRRTAVAFTPPSANSTQKNENQSRHSTFFFLKKKNEWNLYQQPFVCDANPRPMARWHDAACCSPSGLCGPQPRPAEARCRSRTLTRALRRLLPEQLRRGVIFGGSRKARPLPKNKNGPSRKRGRNRNIEAALARRGITSSCLRWSSWLPWERQSWSQPWEHLPWRSSSRLPRWHPPRRRSSWPRACANDGSWAWPPR